MPYSECMIPFDDVPQRLQALKKNRLWLAQETDYSESAIREALAPNSKKRSSRIQKAITMAIEKEEASQTILKEKELQFEECVITLAVPRWQYQRFEKEAWHAGLTLSDWLIKVCEDQVGIPLKKPKVKGLPRAGA